MVKKLLLALCSVALIFGIVGIASALTFVDINDTWQRVDHYLTGPKAWFELELPTLSNTSNPSWEYDSRYVTMFDITLTYNDADGWGDIEIYLDDEPPGSMPYTYLTKFTPDYTNDTVSKEFSFSMLDFVGANFFDGLTSFLIGFYVGSYVKPILNSVFLPKNALVFLTKAIIKGSGSYLS